MIIVYIIGFVLAAAAIGWGLGLLLAHGIIQIMKAIDGACIDSTDINREDLHDDYSD